ncbi:MAG: HAD family phosphatase [Candidatus Omnitrophica bacterium]|nr:HAD family phosphatase [Candidatus Omnitrophota bacterium]
MRRLRSRPKAVIFDMDGVIVDSMPYHFIAWYEALRPFGVRVSCFDVYSREGERWEKTLTELLKKAGITPGRKLLRKIFLRRQRIFKSYYKRFLFNGAKETLIFLKRKGFLLGLVTGTPAKEVISILPKEIRLLFDSIIAGDSVKNGKPHPEPYFKAAASLNVKPSQCAVIENAPYGIKSASKAGMFCIGLTTSLPKEYLKGADIVAESLLGIKTIVDKPAFKK